MVGAEPECIVYQVHCRTPANLKPPRRMNGATVQYHQR